MNLDETTFFVQDKVMTISKVHLNKLLKIMFLDDKARISALRADIREEIGKAEGHSSAGGDFYIPFWYDAKAHVFGTADLTNETELRILGNKRRKNLYPLLHDGFLLWWKDRRRWTNEPFKPGNQLKAHFQIPKLSATVKIDNVLSVVDGLGEEHIIYPYFAPTVPLTPHAAQLGLWVLIKALNPPKQEEVRILDVFQGVTFSIETLPLTGKEENDFISRYQSLINERAEIKNKFY